MQPGLWATAGGLVILAVVSGFADHRRRGRVNLDQAGFMPWPLIQILSLIGALMCAFVALH